MEISASFSRKKQTSENNEMRGRKTYAIRTIYRNFSFRIQSNGRGENKGTGQGGDDISGVCHSYSRSNESTLLPPLCPSSHIPLCTIPHDLEQTHSFFCSELFHFNIYPCILQNTNSVNSDDKVNEKKVMLSEIFTQEYRLWKKEQTVLCATMTSL
ncbi:hypothetical protein LOAG_09903 [Loa loa]|uniref:Uncharacterized protein n=1 Tax=Loa loa TaxID=7209 RepID=A0A1S0TSH7_LOALO|nr:hypothetical protein LOAG_09903 [Loa loa]EFO18591.1 hypothetical protein LOAG_09903 [Loa loa]